MRGGRKIKISMSRWERTNESEGDKSNVAEKKSDMLRGISSAAIPRIIIQRITICGNDLRNIDYVVSRDLKKSSRLIEECLEDKFQEGLDPRIFGNNF